METMRKPIHFGLAIFSALVLALAAAMTVSAGPPAGPDSSQGQVTFSKDIAKILQDKCQDCHRPTGMAPMALMSYSDARPWAKDIKRRVLARTMPPWFVDKHVGIQHFSNDISLSDAQIATITKWVDDGAPQGDPKDMPPAKVFPDDTGWQLAKVYGRQPDLVLQGLDYTVQPHDQDQWFRPTTDVGLSEPRWVMAVEMRPSNPEARAIFHHIVATLDQDETNAPQAQVKINLSNDEHISGAGSAHEEENFMEYAIGKNYDIFPRGSAKLLMPGAKIHWEYHAHGANIDHAITSHAQLAVFLYPVGETPTHRLFHYGFQAYDHRDQLDIAPNTVAVHEWYTSLRAPARLENFQPHMHLRGKAMEMQAILPDGSSRVLSYVDNFNFNWMINYIYADEYAPVLPKGTIIKVTAWHDNTAGNPNNPDPTQWVGAGGRTVDEMAFAHVNVTYLSDDEYKAWVAQHPQTGGRDSE